MKWSGTELLSSGRNQPGAATVNHRRWAGAEYSPWQSQAARFGTDQDCVPEADDGSSNHPLCR